jgi:hypothetical protein
MPSLSELIGTSIIIRSIPLHEEHPVSVRLHAVETGGIWVESQNATDHWLHQMKVASTPKTFVFFLPFAQIAWIMSTVDSPALSEQAFGLHDPKS